MYEQGGLLFCKTSGSPLQPTQPNNEYGSNVPLPRAEHPNCEADSALASSVEVKKEWSYNYSYTRPITLHWMTRINLHLLGCQYLRVKLCMYITESSFCKESDNENVQQNYISHTNRA